MSNSAKIGAWAIAVAGIGMSTAAVAQGNAADSSCQVEIERLIADHPIDFARGSSQLDNASQPLIDVVARAMARCPKARLTITDDGADACVGPPNLRLSTARANAVVDALAARGIARSRLTGVGSRNGTTSTPARLDLPGCSSDDDTGPKSPADIVTPIDGPTSTPTPAPTASPTTAPSPGPDQPVIVPTPIDRGSGLSLWWLLPLAALVGLAAWAWSRRRPTEYPAAPFVPVPRTRIGIPAAVGPPDDLTMIKGVGPKLNALLVSLGILRFDQVAAWTPADVALVDAHLEQFHGRIGRDSWIEQAGLLARGALDDFRSKFGHLDYGE